MAFKSYHTMNGQIIGDSDADYILDGLGSVIGTWRSTGTIQNQYRYSGYGQQVHKSGTGADPYFLWVGGWGYRTRGMVYVRRRTFYEDAAVWTSVDGFRSYTYRIGSRGSSCTFEMQKGRQLKPLPPSSDRNCCSCGMFRYDRAFDTSELRGKVGVIVQEMRITMKGTACKVGANEPNVNEHYWEMWFFTTGSFSVGWPRKLSSGKYQDFWCNSEPFPCVDGSGKWEGAAIFFEMPMECFDPERSQWKAHAGPWGKLLGTYQQPTGWVTQLTDANKDFVEIMDLTWTCCKAVTCGSTDPCIQSSTILAPQGCSAVKVPYCPCAGRK